MVRLLSEFVQKEFMSVFQTAYSIDQAVCKAFTLQQTA